MVCQRISSMHLHCITSTALSLALVNFFLCGNDRNGAQKQTCLGLNNRAHFVLIDYVKSHRITWMSQTFLTCKLYIFLFLLTNFDKYGPEKALVRCICIQLDISRSFRVNAVFWLRDKGKQSQRKAWTAPKRKSNNILTTLTESFCCFYIITYLAKLMRDTKTLGCIRANWTSVHHYWLNCECHGKKSISSFANHYFN